MDDFTYPFKNIADFLKRGDAALINLETPLTPDCKLTQEGMTFCGDLKNVQGLVYAGVNVASIANNHMGNQGLEGIQSTVNVLKQHNINVTGNGEPAIVSVHGMTIGFLGYNGVGNKQKGIAYADIDQIRQDIQTLKQRANIIVVAMHWGTEYTSTPNTFQVELAHKIIDAGADLIIGNHPHWVQGVEEYNGKFIAYSHGNLVFDQMWSQETREGVVGRYTFTNNKLTNVQFIPVIIENYSQPRFAAQQEATKILERMKNGSK
jgi:poly-gamma-glutamate synthesis protein (capsule biosynthesis protein)